MLGRLPSILGKLMEAPFSVGRGNSWPSFFGIMGTPKDSGVLGANIQVLGETGG